MQKFSFYIFYAFAWTITLLPNFLLYRFSDLIRVMLYYVVGYRKEITYINLRNSFPEKTDAEIKAIRKQYYKHLGDLIIEFVKGMHITKKDLTDRYVIKNMDVLDKLLEQGKSVFLSAGHCGNWERLGLAYSFMQHRPELKCAIVKPLSNRYFDDYMNNIRGQFGGKLIPFKQSFRYLLKSKDVQKVVAIAGDQTPTRSEIGYWTRFLNQDTPFFLGIEKMSKMLDFAIIYTDIYRVKRGHYEVEISLLIENPKETEEFEITEKYIRAVENSINKRPYNWLWSHRRWKHKREEEVE